MDVTNVYKASLREQNRALQQSVNFTQQAGIFDQQESALQLQAKHFGQQAGAVNPFLAGLTGGLNAVAGNADLLF